jgi:hypothetical protein
MCRMVIILEKSIFVVKIDINNTRDLVFDFLKITDEELKIILSAVKKEKSKRSVKRLLGVFNHE